MIPALVRWSITHRGFVLGLTALLAVAGVAFGARLKFDALPDLTNNQVLVLTRAPGLTPEEVERLVTRPLEVALGALSGLEEQRSISRYGISSITLVFDDGLDPFRARQLVQERLNIVADDLPSNVEPPELGPPTGGLGEIFHFTVESDQRTTTELLELVELRISPLLRSVPGIVEVNTWGGDRRVLEVLADPIRLAQRGLTLDDLRTGIERATGSAAGASLPSGAGQVLLRAVAWPKNPSELSAAVVAGGREGPPVRVADVAEVRTAGQPRIGAATADGRGETVYVMAQMLLGANALEVMDGIHARMREVRAMMPEDVQIQVVYDRSDIVHGTVRTVLTNLGEGGLLVILVLFALLGSFRAGLLVALAIPLSMLGAVTAMILLGVPGNLMSLGAIDFGLLVDGAVVMVERVFHRFRSLPRPTGPAWREGISDSLQDVARPVFFSVLIILLVYVPVLSLGGVDGKLFRPMALTVVFALGTSLLLALTFVPAAASLVIRPVDVPARDPLAVRIIDRLYPPMLARFVKHPRLVGAGAIAMLGLGVLLFVRAGSEFVPQLDEGDLVIQTTREPDISLESAVLDAGRLEAAILARVPEAVRVTSRVGSPAVATDIMGLEQADVFVAVRPRAEWRRGLDRERLVAEVERAIEELAPGSDPAFTQPIQMRFNELLGGAVADVAVSIYGDDLDELHRLANGLASAIARVPGAADVRVLAPPAVALLEVRPRSMDAAQMGLSTREVLDVVQAVRTGLPVGLTYDGPLRIPVVLRVSGASSAYDLPTLALPLSSGGVVPLSRVADVEEVRTPSVVNRHRGERRLMLGFNVRGGDLGGVVEGARSEAAEAVSLPPGYRLVWGGQFEQMEEATGRLALVIPAVLALILVVLVTAFRRVRPALVLLAAIPFACVGGMVALSVRDLPISISAAIGFIALSGIATLNGVVLMSRVLYREEHGASPAEAAYDAALTRARPVLMTALVAALGFVPMMLARGIGAEVQRPLATVVVGGIVTSTLLTLVVIPSLYPWLAGPRRDVAPPPSEAEAG